ncbi:uncharacterized protein LOC142814609 isoform X2 [Rhipicephalus microplus]|uniref:uncharacterized protein LOC142814609 isoform X2 n=1 Tax=Rhipicephalus microplus TaxID=6941 RepID=UPI003F6C26EC
MSGLRSRSYQGALLLKALNCSIALALSDPSVLAAGHIARQALLLYLKLEHIAKACYGSCSCPYLFHAFG